MLTKFIKNAVLFKPFLLTEGGRWSIIACITKLSHRKFVNMFWI